MTPLLRQLDRADLRVRLQVVSVMAPPTRPLGGHHLQATPEPNTPGAHATGVAHQTPKKDQTVDPIDTWVSHHLSRCPEEPGQDTSGPAAAAETQPCSMGEARSAVTGGAVLRAPRPSTPTTKKSTPRRVTGRGA